VQRYGAPPPPQVQPEVSPDEIGDQ
jgi:hypothetical protein